MRRVDRQELAVRRERVAQRVDPRAGADGDGEVLGDVIDDAREPRRFEDDGGLPARPEVVLRAATAYPHRPAGVGARAQELGAAFGGVGTLSARH